MAPGSYLAISTLVLETLGENQGKSLAEGTPIQCRDTAGPQAQDGYTLVGIMLQPMQWETPTDQPLGSGDGFRCILEWGGEPVVRRSLLEVLGQIKRRLST